MPLRNAEPYLENCFAQLNDLCTYFNMLGENIRIIIIEGDHKDNSRQRIKDLSANLPIEIISYDHGGPAWGSIENSKRFAQLAKMGNVAWKEIPRDCEVVIWVEGDLIWSTKSLIKIIAQVNEDFPIIAPMIMEKSRPDIFYDVWAFRKNGVRFTKENPYHADLYEGLVEVDSVGSCVAMLGYLARKVNFPEEDVFVGLCRKLKEINGSIWVNSTTKVYHP